jgi:hypothetical protein
VKRKTKARLSTFIGCALGGVTLMGPLAGQLTADYQCKRGLCPHSWHRYRYTR